MNNEWENTLDHIIDHCHKCVKGKDRIELSRTMLKNMGYDFPIKCFTLDDKSFTYLVTPNSHTETIIQIGNILVINSFADIAGCLSLEYLTDKGLAIVARF